MSEIKCPKCGSTKESKAYMGRKGHKRASMFYCGTVMIDETKEIAITGVCCAEIDTLKAELSQCQKHNSELKDVIDKGAKLVKLLERAMELEEEHIKSTGWFAVHGTIRDHFINKAKGEVK